VKDQRVVGDRVKKGGKSKLSKTRRTASSEGETQPVAETTPTPQKEKSGERKIQEWIL